MRIPWYLAITLATAVFGCALWLGTRDKDFTLVPDDQAVDQSVREWKGKHPSLPPRQRALPSQRSTETTNTGPENPSSPQIPLGQLETIPGLEHFRDQREHTTESFIQLAILLQSSHNKLDHALLAWERVIDSTDATTTQSLQARKAISALRTTQPIWNADSESNIALVIHINTPTEHNAQASNLLEQLSDDLREASSFQISPQILIKSTPQREGYPAPPIRVWLSSTGENTKETPQLTFRLSEGEAPLEEQLYMAIYRAISGQLQHASELMPPTTLSAAETPLEALTCNLTRLHWKELSQSLHTEKVKQPPAVIIIEESSE